MSNKIETMYPESGRVIKEDGSIINFGNVLADVYDSSNHVLKTSASLSIAGDVEIGAVEIKDSTTDTRATVGTNGLYVDAQNRTLAVTFQDSATVAANGVSIPVGAYKNLTIEIYGTSTTRTVTFYGKGPSGTLRAIPGVKQSGDTNFTMAMNTINNNELWQFDVTGLEYVIMDLTAVSGGNVSVKGRLVA